MKKNWEMIRLRQTLDFPASRKAAFGAFTKRRSVRFLSACCGSFLAAYALACVSVGIRSLPVAACLCSGLRGFPALFSVAGAVLGYFTMFPFLDALEPAAACVMLYCLAAILRQSELPETPRTLPFLALCATCSVGLICSVGAGGAAFFWLVIRCAIAYGASVLFAHLLTQQRPRPAPLQMRRNHAAQTLHTIFRMLQTDAPAASSGSVAALYDTVSERVCLRCPGYHNCYELRAAETYHALSSAAARFLPHGTADAADFSDDFSANCRQLDRLIEAINHELHVRLGNLQASHRLEEYRSVIGSHYQILSSLLAGRKPRTAREMPRFRPELGVRALGRRGARISGDRGACFVEGGILYLLLCDGMGTGPDAAQEAKTAITLLGGLLKAGAKPEEALNLLNGVYILRDSACFTTVDLLVLDLSTGTGDLYKWGAAPSYLLSRKLVKKMGTASPPPGISAQGGSKPERLRLSLQKGEKLVLLSDGLESTRAEACLTALAAEEPQRIATEVVAQQAEAGEDDMSAVVLRLHLDEVS